MSKSTFNADTLYACMEAELSLDFSFLALRFRIKMALAW